MKKLLITATIVASGIVSTSAFSADIAAGKARSAACAACHGATGVSVAPIWPNLAGQQEAYLAKQIKDFRDGKRKDPSMSPMAMGLTDADADNLAAYYASLK